ncbi:unnamed protein product, partial [Adineta steineri]
IKKLRLFLFLLLFVSYEVIDDDDDVVRNSSLKPSTFYGLTRNGLIFAKHTTGNDGEEQLDAERATHPSMDNEE